MPKSRQCEAKGRCPIVAEAVDTWVPRLVPSWIPVRLGRRRAATVAVQRGADADTEEAIRTARELGTPGYEARSLLDLGLLCRAQKRWAEARTHLQEASRVALPLKSSVLDTKIQKAMASPPG